MAQAFKVNTHNSINEIQNGVLPSNSNYSTPSWKEIKQINLQWHLVFILDQIKTSKILTTDKVEPTRGPACLRTEGRSAQVWWYKQTVRAADTDMGHQLLDLSRLSRLTYVRGMNNSNPYNFTIRSVRIPGQETGRGEHVSWHNVWPGPQGHPAPMPKARQEQDSLQTRVRREGLRTEGRSAQVWWYKQTVRAADTDMGHQLLDLSRLSRLTYVRGMNNSNPYNFTIRSVRIPGQETGRGEHVSWHNVWPGPQGHPAPMPKARQEQDSLQTN